MTTTSHHPSRNGVDTAALFATIDAVGRDPELAKFRFKVTNRWVSGTHSRSTVHGFFGARQDMTHKDAWTYSADHPAVLTGQDTGPTPAEFLLHALAACLAAGVANVAAARGVELTDVTAEVAGEVDLLGMLGLSDEVRNGFEQVKVRFTVRGDAPERLRAVVEQSRRRSAVYDMLTNGVPVTVEVDAG